MTPQLASLFEFLRFPSISTDSRHAGDVRACAGWLRDRLVAMGLQTRLDETPGHPVVVAHNGRRAGLPTVLIYGHYDVQPVDPLELWQSRPFEPEVRDGRIWARGATDNKGQMLAHVLGVGETLARHGSLPVNLVFLFEGEEEIGSLNLGAYLAARAAELACDVVAVSDTGMVAPGVPTLGYGLRGIACCEVVVRGPKGDLHSGVYGGAVMNPVTAAARLIASLHDAGGRVAIDGFYDAVREPAAWELEAWREVPTDDAALLAQTGSPALFGEAGRTTLERLWVRPTAEVNGFGGGYQGEGSKTVLPAEARFKLSFRLVPDQNPVEILALVNQHLLAATPPGVTVEVRDGHSGSPYLADPRGAPGRAACRALERTFGRPPVLIREGGSIPIINTFKEILGADSLMLGLALPDCRIHAPNENFAIENFEAGIRLNQALLEELARG
jgi:acetylornithine deacetylase/succinyl-diaminopimelate desuccinylase-like protein